MAAQLLVDTADAVIHRWFVEDDGNLAPPERMTGELRRMMGAYLSLVSAAPHLGVEIGGDKQAALTSIKKKVTGSGEKAALPLSTHLRT